LWEKEIELSTQTVGETSNSELPSFSARTTASWPHLVSGERLRQRELEGVPGVRERFRAHRRDFRVIGQLDQAVNLHFVEVHRDAPARPIREGVKRVFDVVGALLLGVVFLPLIVAIAILLRIEGGPIIFRHRRVGRHGALFDCLKFRSMVPEADRVLRDLLERQPELKAEWIQDHKLRHDPRITAVGRFLRRTSLDELPQLWNVILGEMSLVGPRPVVREELMRYGRCAHMYLSARPGITGLWQVTGRNDTNYRRRVALDVYYVRRHNIGLDLYILLKTTHVVIAGAGAY
jgi:exopolysaccharide production protein ExoY